jgi:TolA-binding protein
MKKLFTFLALIAFAFTLTAQNKATAKADALFAQGSFALAATEYSKLASGVSNPKHPAASEAGYVFNRLGESFFNLKEYAKAEAAYVKAKEKGVKDAKFQLNFGDVLLANNKADQALATYQQLLTENPASTEAQDRIRRVEFNIAAVSNPNVATHPVTLDKSLSATNNQFSLAWYRGALLFSSDRAKPAGSPKPAPITKFFASKDGKIQPLQPMTPPAADRAFAYDDQTKTYYAMRCPAPAKGKPGSCNIYAYSRDPKGNFGKPASQSFHDNSAVVGFPTLNSDGNVMFFTIQKGGTTNIYVAKKTGTNTWSSPIMLPAVINTDKIENYPQLFQDSILFFASNGHLGMGGLDIFYTKISIDGEPHAISRNSDLSKLEFSTPTNLGAPINSGADDISALLQPNGIGGLFISNRTVNRDNNHSIYRFNQRPYMFGGVEQNLVSEPVVTEVAEVIQVQAVSQPVAAPIATPVVETPVETKATGTETAILKQKDEQIAQLNVQVSQLNALVTQLKNDLATNQANTVHKAGAPAQQPVSATPSEIVYRVQIAASTNASAPGEYRATFDALHRVMPDLRMETILGEDGFHRYVTVPFLTFAEADAVRKKIQALGYQCFVSGYKGNNRVSMSVR